MSYYPLFLELDSQPVLVVGAGEVAERKIRPLLAAGAAVEVVARRLGPAVADWVAAGRVKHLGENYDSAQLPGKRLIIAATGDPQLNHRVYREAEAVGLLVNAVDDTANCRFISPAVIERGPVQIAISTGGASPLLARWLRNRIEALLPAGLGRLASAARSLRGRVKRRLPAASRKAFWEQALHEARIAEFSGLSRDQILARWEHELRAFRRPGPAPDRKVGRVYLVGAGPGDPDLLTLRALQLLGQADVILHDRLVSPAILERARRDADRIYVGKTAGRHHCGQREIERLMIAEARKGRTVVRLKGGDPFVFGRGGEEVDALRCAGVDCEVVPGITAATACAAAAGIPLTHRDHAQCLTLVTGHAAGGPTAPDWAKLAGPGRTVVVYMGVSQAAGIRRALLDAGLPGHLPAAVVVDGTLESQVILTGTIDGLEQLAAGVPDGRPGLLIIGQVAALGSTLSGLEPIAAVSAAA